MFEVAFALSTAPAILRALGTTLGVTLLAGSLALSLGFALELARRGIPGLRYPTRFLIDFIRSTPVLVQIYFLYFVLPIYGVRLPALLIGVMALGLYYSGYLAEVFKAGIDGIPRGQFEAADALGLSFIQRTRLVVAPQMLRNVAAPAGGYVISLFKSTPYLAVIAVREAFGSALDIASDTFRYAEPMAVVGAIFLAIAVSFSWLIGRVEQRLALRTLC